VLLVRAFFFSIYINDLPNEIIKSKISLFADDSNIYNASSINDVLKLKNNLEHDLDNVVKWLDKNKVKLNIGKTQFLMVGKQKVLDKCKDFCININGLPIQRVQTLKILGITFDESLSFNNHCNIVQSKCYQKLSVMYPFKYVLSLENKCIIINALVFSIVSYGCIIWGRNLSKSNTKLIDNIMKMCAKYVLGKRKFDSITNDM